METPQSHQFATCLAKSQNQIQICYMAQLPRTTQVKEQLVQLLSQLPLLLQQLIHLQRIFFEQSETVSTEADQPEPIVAEPED